MYNHVHNQYSGKELEYNHTHACNYNINSNYSPSYDISSLIKVKCHLETNALEAVGL